MKYLKVFFLVVLVGIVGLQPCLAKITSRQIEMLKELSQDAQIEEQALQDFITNFDEIQSWIAKDIISPTSLGKSSGTCQLCSALVGLVLGAIRNGVPLGLITSILKTACQILLVPNQLTIEVCNGAVEMYAKPLQFILTENRELTGLDICGIYTGVEGGCDPINENLTNWVIEVNENKPGIEEIPLLPDDTPTVRILHLTDIHPDLHYVVGSNKDCDEPMCCRGRVETNETLQAGYHGDYRCDMPEYAMLDLFRDAAERYDNYSFVLMTGDLVHHTIWNTNKQDNLNHFNKVNTPLVEEIFNNTPIYPVIGNHEPHPCNMFPPQSVWGEGDAYDLSWVYNSIADSYSVWLPEDAQATFRKAGYYTLLIPEGPRLIAINTNFCYTNNFWLFYNATDPEDQLQWLADRLQEAEDAEEVVYIAGHIPPGKGDCWTVWNSKFHDIIIRYEAIIKAQFYGHTHNDETTIFFDTSVDPPRPANVLNIGVSTTPYTYINPGYKVFFADGAGDAPTWEMLDHETWVYNLSEANAGGEDFEPHWYKLYSMREAFDLASLRPNDLYDLILRMVDDDELFQKYFTYFHKGSHLISPCDTKECKMFYLCEIVKADSGDYSHCARLDEIAEGSTTTTTTAPSTPDGTTERSTPSQGPGPNPSSTTTESFAQPKNGKQNIYLILSVILMLFYSY